MTEWVLRRAALAQNRVTWFSLVSFALVLQFSCALRPLYGEVVTLSMVTEAENDAKKAQTQAEVKAEPAVKKSIWFTSEVFPVARFVLLEKNGDLPIANATVAVEVNGKRKSDTTDINGVFRLPVGKSILTANPVVEVTMKGPSKPYRIVAYVAPERVPEVKSPEPSNGISQ